MTIEEQMVAVVDDIISEYGLHHKVSRVELYELLGTRYGRTSGSIIPSDYCYNRTNKGIEFLKKPRLFFFHGDGMYECLGENYPFSGAVYTRKKGESVDVEVGSWNNGVFQKNDNWDLYCLK